MHLREKLSLGALEVAIINEEQFVIKRNEINIIEIVAIIPTLITDLRIRLGNNSLDVCNIDGSQKVVKRDGPKLIEILSDIVPINEVATLQECRGTPPVDTSASTSATNELRRYFIFA